MFNFDTGLAKRNGPLAKVWLASHMGDRKLSKAALLGVSIPRSVGAIFGSEELPFALRLSGQLLLGVARIYSRKAKYLVDDCNDALTKIKMTFRPGATAAIDLPAEQAQASRAAITRQDQTNEFDALYQDIELDLWNPEVYQPKATPGKSVAIAREADITRQEDDDDDVQMPQIEFGDELFGYDGGRDVELSFMREGSVGHKRARTEEPDDFDMEYGREAINSSGRLSQRYSQANGFVPNADDEQFFMDDAGGEGYGMEIDWGPQPDRRADRTLTSGGDFDLSAVLDEHEELARQSTPAVNGQEDGQRTPRGTSPTEQQPNGEANGDLDVTPRTAKRVADTAALNSAKKRRTTSKAKGGKQIIDDATELAVTQGGRRGPLGSQSQSLVRATDPSLLVAPRFLPGSRAALRMFEIDQDPVGYYLPRVLPNGNLYAGPPDLIPELAKLFEITDFKGRSPAKKQRRTRDEPDVSSEMGRREENGRASDRFSVGNGTARFEDDWDPNALMDGGGNEGGNDGFEPDYAPMSFRGKSSTPAPPGSRDLTPLASDLFTTPQKPREPGEGMLGDFDFVPPTESSQRIQSQQEERQAASSGWSKNTVKALQVLNRELGPAPVEGEEVEDKVLGFEEASEKVRRCLSVLPNWTDVARATRPAAASFFFELLVLGSRGCVDLKQTTPFGDISISAKPKMWDVVGRDNMAPRTSSVAPETSPTRTPIAGR